MIACNTARFRGTGLLLACLLSLWFWIALAAIVWWLT